MAGIDDGKEDSVGIAPDGEPASSDHQSSREGDEGGGDDDGTGDDALGERLGKVTIGPDGGVIRDRRAARRFRRRLHNRLTKARRRR